MTAADETDALYALPLDELTKARNELARHLRRDGRRDDAAAVAGLRKPTLPAWVVDQLARARRSDVQERVAAAARSGPARPTATRGSVRASTRSSARPESS